MDGGKAPFTLLMAKITIGGFACIACRMLKNMVHQEQLQIRLAVITMHASCITLNKIAHPK